MSIFNTVDLLIIGTVLLSLIFGILKGFLREIFSFIFFMLAIILASLFYSDVSGIFLKKDISNISSKPVPQKTEKNENKKNIQDNIKDIPVNTVKNLLAKKNKKKTVADFIAFLTIFFFILIIGSIITYFIKRILIRGPLKSVDRILGAFFGLIRGVLICSVVIYGVRKIDYKVEKINDSYFVKLFLNDTVDVLQDFLPEGVKN